ncbi:hypothetical protein ACFPMF_07405 [Larkinella bovis]|uniref:Uncharacterized protein n=1 Tax=Larkinella bovis TaxID=683041 RepID=A0ABW0I9V5_9BACT
MIIKQRRIRKPENFLTEFAEGSNFYVSLPNIEDFHLKLIGIGFGPELAVGTQVLPKPIGAVSRFNAQGGFRVLKDLPKETAYREIWWEWEDWNKNQYADVKYVPYERYQREPIPAPSEELTIIEKDGNKLIVSRKLLKADIQLPAIKHLINLFLELFGECELLTDALIPVYKFEVKRLHWDVLPQGKYPWQRLKSEVMPLIEQVSEQKQKILAHRLEVVASHEPDFVATGKAGFHGYLIFGFSKLGIYVLESMFVGNATYILGENWANISQMTKAEILNGELHLDRLVHREGWTEALRKQFVSKPAAI